MWRIPPAILSGFLSVGQRPPERAQRAQGAALRWAGGRVPIAETAPQARLRQARNAQPADCAAREVEGETSARNPHAFRRDTEPARPFSALL